MSPTGELAIEVVDLTIRYGELTAVDNLSFTATRGAVTALLGPNGAGKSSTIEALEGYRHGFLGQLEVLGLDPIRQHAQLVPRIGVMLQNGGVYPGIRVHEVAELFCAFYDRRREPDALIELVGLGDRSGSTWKQLSGGEQQRLSLALALAGNPEVAFLDEPTAGVDVAGRQLVRRIIRDLADSGCAVLLTTHELDEAERLADQVHIIDHGRLVASGTPTELMRSGGSTEVRFGSVNGLDTSALTARLGVAVTETSPGEYLVATEGTPAVVAALTGWLAEQNLSIADLRVGRQRLEDVFLRLTAAGDERSFGGAAGSRERPRRASRTRGQR